MINIYNINCNTDHIYEGFFSFSKEITKIIYSVVNKIFRYAERNQNSLKAITLSYLCIDTTVLAYQTLSNTRSDLNYCQEMICALWNTTIPNHTSFLYPLNFRCNPSDADYSPFRHLTTCLESLCHYAKNMNINFASCLTYKSNYRNATEESQEDESINFARNLWNTVCPLKKFRHHNAIKEAIYVNNCIENLCAHYNTTFEVKEKSSYLSELCENTINLKISKMLERLSKVVHSTEQQFTTTDTWTKSSIIVTAVASVASIAGSILSVYLGILSYRFLSKSNPIISLDIPGLIRGLRDILLPLSQTTGLAASIGAPDLPVATQNIPLDTLFTEVEDLVTDLQEIIEDPIVYSEGAEGIGNEAGELFSSIATGKTMISKIYKIQSQSDYILDQLSSYISDFMKRGFQIQILEETNTLVMKKGDRVFRLGMNLNKFAQTFINDPLSSSFNVTNNLSNNFQLQLNLIKDNLIYWSDALCRYYYDLFCRLPLPRHNTDSIVLFPNDQIFRAVNNSMGEEQDSLCHLFYSDIWCNWTKFLQSTISNYSIFNDLSCNNDVLHLRLLPLDNNTFQGSTIGGCYNQTILIKV